jgi:hypothetical protein
MDHRVFAALLALSAGPPAAVLPLVAGCSSSTSPAQGSGCVGTSCHDGSAGGGGDTSGGGQGDGGTGDEHTGTGPGIGAHDGAAPDALYAACAVQGSFGWPCTAANSGPDPTDCTDPNYPDCFVGGQGAWCTATCSGTCAALEDAGCTPTACNGRGYCK